MRAREVPPFSLLVTVPSLEAGDETNNSLLNFVFIFDQTDGNKKHFL